MATFSSVVASHVLPEVPGCVSLIAINALRDAVIRFCDKTHYWKSELTPFSTVANQSEYTLTPPNDAAIAMAESVRHKGIPLTPKTEQQLDEEYGHTWRTDKGTPSYFASKQRDKVILVQIPSITEANALSATAVLRPSRTATTFPDTINNDYLEEIAAGAKARLMAMPAVTWANPELSAYYGKMFDDAVKRAAGIEAAGFNRSTLRVRMWSL